MNCKCLKIRCSRKLLGLRDEVNGEYNKEPHENLSYDRLDIRLGGAKQQSYKHLPGKLQRRSLGRPKGSWEDNRLLKWIAWKYVVRIEMDWTVSGSCRMDSGISLVKPLGFTATQLFSQSFGSLC
jgi:hypothetical protein